MTARALRLIQRLGILPVVVLALATPRPASPAAPDAAGNRDERPNILLAIADDWSWPHAGVYDDPVVRTPTFDRVAREGVLFEHAYVASPSCTSSRAALLTGQWHWRLEESANLWSTLRREYAVYPELLEKAGYVVGFEGKGWGPGLIEPGGRTRNPAGPEYQSFAEFLERLPHGTPFCFWFGSHDPHRAYDEGSGARSGIDLERIRLFPHFPDRPEVRRDVADYYYAVQRFDTAVGAILEALRARGTLERTLVVVTSDNGMPFPRCKANLYDCGLRVPLAIRGPGVAAGRTVRAFVSLTDLAPTFLELGRAAAPATMTGRSLWPLLGGDAPDPEEVAVRDHVLAGKERHVPAQEAPDRGGTPMRSIRTRDFLYIRNFRPDRWPAGTPDHEKAVVPGAWLADCDNGPTKTSLAFGRDRSPHDRWLYDLAFAKRTAEELYDLRRDPGQLQNVAADPAYREVKAELRARLDAELERTADPRLVGGADRLEAYPYYGGAPKWEEPSQKDQSK
jgi:N-sulfoglucosamine sulfohydrolase